MALTKCKDCGQEVSNNAKQCPGCGAPIKGRASWIMTGLALVVLVWILGSVFGQPG